MPVFYYREKGILISVSVFFFFLLGSFQLYLVLAFSSSLTPVSTFRYNRL